MLNLVRALILIASTILLVSAFRVFMAIITEVSVCPTPELCQVATKVALELDMTEAVLFADELLADIHVL